MTTPTEKLDTALKTLPLVAILRGLEPAQALAIGDILIDAGFCIIEVPLNSSDPFKSIELLAGRFGETAVIGAGTVLDPASVARLEAAGGELVVMPHSDPAVIKAAKALGLACLPGVATPTEAWGARAPRAPARNRRPAAIAGCCCEPVRTAAITRRIGIGGTPMASRRVSCPAGSSARRGTRATPNPWDTRAVPVSHSSA